MKGRKKKEGRNKGKRKKENNKERNNTDHRSSMCIRNKRSEVKCLIPV